MLPITLTDKAKKDIQEAYNFLESNDLNLGEKLLESIDEYLGIIELNPLLFKAEYKNVRQVRVKPFRYLIRYKVYTDEIVIIQLFQGNQHPKKRKV